MAQHNVHTVVIGTGFSGLGMAIQLKKDRRNDFVVLEQAGEVGGTWRDNTYPGCACDVQSHLYSYSFELNPKWSRMFAPQEEILEYLKHCAKKYEVYPHIRFETPVVEARFDETAGRWNVKAKNGDVYVCKVLVSGIGGLSRPAYPDIPGMENFKGKLFHSQQWEHDYDLKGKKVAVIGTGASAIQFVPAIAPDVKELRLFQRTPPWILSKPDRPIRELEQWLFENVPLAQKLFRSKIYVTLEARVVAFVKQPRIMELVKYVAKRHIRKQISGPKLREAVTPDYSVGCKRILMSDEYYPALERSNVRLVTEGISKITPQGVVTSDGEEHKVDTIILGTGFMAAEPIPRNTVFGRGGVDLLDAWEGKGAEAYKGTTISGFPNFFTLMGPNTGLGHSSMVYMIESQIEYVRQAMAKMEQKGLDWVEVLPGVQEQYNEGLQDKLGDSVWQAGGCKSWYIDPKTGRNVTLWPGFTFEFRNQLRKFEMKDYAVGIGGKKYEPVA